MNPTPEDACDALDPLAPHPARPADIVVWWIQAVSLVAAAAALVLAYGFNPPLVSKSILDAAEIAAVAAFVLSRIWRVFPLSGGLRELRRFPLDYAVIVLGAVVVAVNVFVYHHPVRHMGWGYLVALGAVMVTQYALALYHTLIDMVRAGHHPAGLLAIGFAAVVLLGGFLLTLPTVSRPILAGEHPYQWREHVVNCLFTATSAVSLTGLTVYRTGYDFTLGGQAIILILIQIGGLGIMSLGAVFAMLLGRRGDPAERLIMGSALDENARRGIGRVIGLACMTTFAIEAIGTLMLYPMWTEPDVANGGRLFWSVFHAISAFCNAGFALHDNSLIPYRGSWQVYGAIMPLIVLGGLGLPVLRELAAHGTAWVRSNLHGLFANGGKLTPAQPPRHPYSLHTKLALATTGMLILGGAGLFWITETPARWTKQYKVRMDQQVLVTHVPDRMATMPPGERWWSALFLSVTSRTGGFRTVLADEQSLSSATHYLLCLLMFIGGSPASAAGGLKTVTFAVLLMAIVAALRGRDRVQALGRTLPTAVVNHAFVVASLMFAMVFAVTWLLCYLDSHSLRQILFETISASGNVGLSTGITPNLTKIGRVLLVLCMFAGRVGPLTLAMVLAGPSRPTDQDCPVEQPIIG